MGTTRDGRPRAVRSSRRLAVVAAVALGLGSLTACGSDGGPATAASSGAPAAAAGSQYSFTPPTRAETGVEVTDTDHGYHLLVSPDWVEYTDLAPGDPAHKAWAVGPPTDGMTPSVSVVTEKTLGMSLHDYIDLSIRNLPRFIEDAELGASGKVKALDGSTLATFEYTGMGVRFLALVAMGHGHSVVVTLATAPSAFEEVRDQVMPYLITVTATS
jgi:hypothetical protein